LVLHKLHTQVNIFGFTFLDLLIKFMKMRLLYILYCPPTLPRDGEDLLIPWPFYMCRFTGPPPPILSSYWLAHWPITRSRFWQARGEGGDRYNTTTCGMAEGSKDPCISHVDASHAEWPRIESSLLFCNFFYIVKVIEKGLFSEGEIGFTRKKTSKTRNRYFFEFFDT
jgi:hypothetical protein